MFDTLTVNHLLLDWTGSVRTFGQLLAFVICESLGPWAVGHIQCTTTRAPDVDVRLPYSSGVFNSDWDFATFMSF